MSKIKIRKKHRIELRRFAEYMIGGGLWFWSGYVIIVYLNGKIPLFWANFAGNLVGITLNFVVERYWVFKTNKPTKLGVATWRYIIYTALNAFALNYLILLVLRNNGIQPAIGQFIASGFFTIWNYFWYKVWVFKGQTPIKRTKHHA